MDEEVRPIIKVLYLTKSPSPHRVEFFNELSKTCELTVVYESKRFKERDKERVAQSSGGYKEVFLSGWNVRRGARFCPGVLKFVRRDQFDVVVVGAYDTPTAKLAISALRRKKIPFALNTDGGFIDDTESERKRNTKRRLISGASWWLSSGPLTSEYFLGYGATKDKIFEYPFSSVRQAEVLPKAMERRQKLLVRGQKVLRCETLFIAVGQFIPRKGFYEFLKVWASEERGTTGLAIIGGGPEEALYKKIAQENPNIWILPFLKKQVLAEYFKAADAFVLPTNEDVWGLVVGEAMSYGLPIFSTDRCIAAETMKGTGVRIFPAGDNSALISAMEDFEISEKKDEMISDVLLRAGEYTIEKMAQRHMEIFNSILDE